MAAPLKEGTMFTNCNRKYIYEKTVANRSREGVLEILLNIPWFYLKLRKREKRKNRPAIWIKD